MLIRYVRRYSKQFQHTAARRRLVRFTSRGFRNRLFQHTAARRRLEFALPALLLSNHVSTHSRPKAAGCRPKAAVLKINVSTHSRPKAAGDCLLLLIKPIDRFQHTAARRRLVGFKHIGHSDLRFQHTAARRRLAYCLFESCR